MLGQVDQLNTYNTTWSGPAVTTYAYDLSGNKTQSVDPAGNVTTTTYDTLGRVLTFEDPDAGLQTTTYDTAGLVLTTKDSLGTTATMAYDTLGRILTVKLGRGVAEQYVYDKANEAGLLDYVSSFTSGAEFRVDTKGYDFRNRPTGYDYVIPSITGWTDTGLAGTYSFTQTYDIADRPTSTTYPAAGWSGTETVSTGYSPTGAAVTLQGASPYVSATSLDNQGRIAERILGSGTYEIKRSYVWDVSTGRLLSLTASQGGVPIQQETMVYDAVGNLLSTAHDRVGTASDHDECFTYDGRSRLESVYTTVGGCGGSSPTVAGPGAYQSGYTVDKIGNMTTGPAGTYTYPASGAGVIRPHAPTQADQTATGGPLTVMGWNADGTMNTKTVQGAVTTYTWDAFNRLTKAASTAATQEMKYGPGNERVLMKDSAGVHLYLGGLAERHVAAGVITDKRYYTIGGTTVAVRTKIGAATPTLDFLLGDVRGSIAMTVTEGTSATTEQWYSAYGKTRAGNTTAATTRGYIGQHQDAAAGLNYLNNRYQDPSTGVFISVDPLIGQTGEPYLYGSGNPTTLSDPEGLCTGWLCNPQDNKASKAGQPSQNQAPKSTESTGAGGKLTLSSTGACASGDSPGAGKQCTTFDGVRGMIENGGLSAMSNVLPSNYGRFFMARGSARLLGEDDISPSLLQATLNFFADGMKVSYTKTTVLSIYSFEGVISYTGGMYPMDIDGQDGVLYGGVDPLANQAALESQGEFNTTGYFAVLSTTSTLGYSLSDHNKAEGGDATSTNDASPESVSTYISLAYFPVSFSSPRSVSPTQGRSMTTAASFQWLVTG